MPARNPNFAGRDLQLQALSDARNSSLTTVPVLVVSGLGGVGKTQLAIEHSWRRATDYDLVWWVSAEVPAAIPASLAALSQRFGLSTEDPGAVVGLLHAELVRRRRWLIVFDNAGDPATIAPYLPPAGDGHVVVTSRNPAWRSRGVALDLEVWPDEEAVGFLLARTGSDDHAGPSMRGSLACGTRWSSVWQRARPSTVAVNAYAHDLKAFFSVVGRQPADVTSRDVMAAAALRGARLGPRGPAPGRWRVFVAEGKGDHERLVPMSSTFFNTVATYDVERAAGAGEEDPRSQRARERCEGVNTVRRPVSPGRSYFGAVRRGSIERSAGAAVPPAEEPAGIVRNDVAWVLLVAATTAYIVLTGRWAMRNHDGFGTLGYDFGIFDQGVWLLSRFERPFVTVMGRHLLGDHTSFILLPLVPVYWLVPSAKVLLAAQAAALGLSAVPVFLIAREKLRDELLASVIALAFLAHPALASTSFEQFHPDAFEVPILLFGLWFMIRERWRPFLACVVLLLLVKEDVAALTVALGIYVAVRHDRRIGLVTSVLSVGYALFAVGVVKPHWGVPGSYHEWRVPFGGVGGLLRTTFSDPTALVRHLSADGRPWYAWQMLASFGLVSLLAPGILLVAAGPFAANMLSTFSYQHDIRYHYGTLILPVLITAAIFGVARAVGFRRRALMVAVMAVSALLSAFLWGPIPGARDPGYIGDPGSAFAHDARAAIGLIPLDASVSAFYPFTTHLTHREQIYEFPNPFRARWWGLGEQDGQRLAEADRVEYVVLPKLGAYFTPELQDVVLSLRDDYVTRFDSENVLLLQRSR